MRYLLSLFLSFELKFAVKNHHNVPNIFICSLMANRRVGGNNTTANPLHFKLVLLGKCRLQCLVFTVYAVNIK